MPRSPFSGTARVLLAIGRLLAPVVQAPATAPVHAADAQPPYVTLVGRAVLPTDIFAPGPPSGFAITGDIS